MNKTKRQYLKLWVSLGILVALSLGGLNFEKNSPLENHVKVVRIGLPGISNTTLEAGGIAVANYYFDEELAKEGYKAELVFFQQAGPALNEAFAANKIDVALYGDLPITVLKSKGADVKVFAVDNAHLQFGTLVQNDSPAQKIADLQGQKVIYGKGTVQQRYFQEITRNYGLDPNKFEMVNSVGADAQSVFGGHQAEAIFSFYDNVLYMQHKGLGRVIDSTLDKPSVNAQSLAVGRNAYLQENPRVPVAIIRGLVRAQAFAAQNPEQAFAIFARNSRPIEVYRQVYSADPDFSNFNPEITSETENKLNRAVDFLVNNQLIKQRFDVKELITTEYYQRYLAEK